MSSLAHGIETTENGAKAIGSRLTAIMLLAFMSGLVAFFASTVNSLGAVWRVLFYGFWLVSVVTVPVLLLKMPRDFKGRVAGLAAMTALLLAVCLMHPLDGMTRNYISLIVLISVFAVISAAHAGNSVRGLAAWIVVLNALILFADILFPVGLSNTLGRAAGFMVNPNIAALSLLIGASASISGVPTRWKYAFCTLVAAAIFFTLSRSTLILGSAVLVVSLLLNGSLRGSGRTIDLRFLVPDRRAMGVAVFFLLWLVLTLLVNDRFSTAASSSYTTLRLALDLLGLEGYGNGSYADLIGQLGDSNSVLARKVLFLRSLYAFLHGPFFGQGLAYAYALEPHNTYLLFAVAFGYPGLFIVFLALGLFTYVCGRREIHLALSLAAGMLVSHDLLMPVFAAPLAVGLGWQMANRLPPPPAIIRTRLAPYVWGAALLVSVTVAFVLLHDRSAVSVPLEAGAMRHDKGDDYIALVPNPAYSGIVRVAASDDPSLGLLENGQALASVPSAQARTGARGQFLLKDGYVVKFSSTDGSDPTTNSRAYSLHYMPRPHPLAAIVLCVFLLWAAGYNLLSRRIGTVERSSAR